MKKLIYGIGILSLIIITILNVIITAKLDLGEHITIQYHSVLRIVFLVLLGIGIYGLSNKINEKLNDKDSEKKKKVRKCLFVLGILIYLFGNIMWVAKVTPNVVGDSVHVCNLAQVFYRENETQLLSNLTYAGISLKDYMQAYPQQISLAFVFHVVFRIIHSDVMEILRGLNILGNMAIVMAVYLIGKHLANKYKTNKVLLLTLILTFVSLPMLATFIYGDIPSIALCLFSVYFMMKYRETKQIRYVVGASIFTMIAYMMRMNSLIFVIATVMYLLLAVWQELKQSSGKENAIKIAIVVLYVMISILPASLVKNYYFAQYELDKSKTYPNISYLLMGMEESPRASGWYSEEIAQKALQNPQEITEEYKEKIKERVIYFSKNLGEMAQFYYHKIGSMWTETTYSVGMNNNIEENDRLRVVAFYQKALVILIGSSSIIVLIQNRKKMSLDVLFLITIFIGGFTFHLLWEAKSRYILPYLLVLIPVASIQIQKFRSKKKQITEEKQERKEILESK